jgi:hypothetical protein
VGREQSCIDQPARLSLRTFQNVRGVVAFEDLFEMVLVGHSYEGTVLAALAKQMAHRLAISFTYSSHR